jgi:Leucine-rich repeat (LRR) protein
MSCILTLTLLLIVLSITGLRNLETLNLGNTDFKESILIESLGALPSLKTLYASYSNFKHVGKGQ